MEQEFDLIIAGGGLAGLLLAGLNVHAGQLTYGAVGQALGLDVTEPQKLLKAA